MTESLSVALRRQFPDKRIDVGVSNIQKPTIATQNVMSLLHCCKLT